jgi:ribosomal protein L17
VVTNDIRNPDGTYNGVKAMAQLSGLSEEEIRWTWERAKELRTAGVVDKLALTAQLKREAAERFGKQRRERS